MEYPGFQMGSGGMMPFPGANPMMMAMQNAAYQQVGVRACVAQPTCHLSSQSSVMQDCREPQRFSCIAANTWAAAGVYCMLIRASSLSRIKNTTPTCCIGRVSVNPLASIHCLSMAHTNHLLLHISPLPAECLSMWPSYQKDNGGLYNGPIAVVLHSASIWLQHMA